MVIRDRIMSMVRGDDEEFSLSIKISEQRLELGEGDILKFTVRKTPLSKEKLIYKEVSEFSEGNALFIIDSKDTQELDFGEYVYDIELTRENGKIKTLVNCSCFIIEEEVTYG